MIEKRELPRIRFDARCILFYENCAHEAKMVNISLGGAMISMNDSAIIPLEEKCLLRLFAGINDTPDDIEVIIDYSAFSCIGVRFLAFDADTNPQLYSRIELLSWNQAKYRVAYP